MRYRLPLSLLVMVCVAPQSNVAGDDNLSTQLMHCTFKITDGQTNGTAFVLSRSKASEQPQSVLVTAAHGLEQMKKDRIRLAARKPAANESFEKREVEIRIRREGKPLWAKHPEQDVAAIDVSLPAEIVLPCVPVSLLATDETLKQYQVQPGDLVRCLGFPHAAQFEANSAGFPVVRIGCLASFPILPTRRTKTFLVDVNAFEGDSGAAVYLDDPHRFVAGETEAQSARLILGLVAGQILIDEKFANIYQSGLTRHRMGLGVVVHATAIRETIELLDVAAER
ncbi:MAG TPA: hypothetical protein VMV10_19955 [Pirellulales bacterium]|nr:hypothetical protein [Pirellulales bacterium]